MQLVSQALLPPSRSPLADGAALRQLRHLSANAWQRILCEIWKLAGPGSPDELQALAHEIERRVTHAVALSDALFGFTHQPGSLATRLHALCNHTVELLADARQDIGIVVCVEEGCPPRLHEPLLRAAQEMACNAMKHGLHARARGMLAVTVSPRAGGGAMLTVSDDGWGPCPRPQPGEGLSLLRQMAEDGGGSFTLQREGQRTVARLALA